MRTRLALGDAVLVFSMFVWLTIGVGPWWLGVVLFFVAGGLNYVGKDFVVVDRS